MSLGAGIFLIAVGAILAFAVDIQVSGVDLQVIGYILMAAGALGVLLGVILMARRRSAVSTSTEHVDPVTGDRVRRDVRSDGV